MQIFVVFSVLIFAAVFSGVSAWYFSNKKAEDDKRRRNAQKGQKLESENPDGVNPGRCPICNSFLIKPEKINSVVFAGANKADQRCNILGCPHCYPQKEAGVRRICPVCRKEVPEKGYLLAHLFLRKDKSHHVHIVGCTECHKKN